MNLNTFAIVLGTISGLAGTSLVAAQAADTTRVRGTVVSFAGPTLTVKTREGNTDAIGARIRVTSASRTQIRDVKSGSSYLSQSDLRVHFGLAAATRADRIEVVCPLGRTESVANVPANQITIEESRGIVARQPLSR